MNSNLVDILVGLSVNICRSDGRVHPAIVKSVDTVKSTIHVEWTEKSICRGKEVDVDELCAMNKELIEYMTGTAAPTPKVPAVEKKYEGRLRSSRIPGPSTSSAPVTQVEDTVPRKSMARQTSLFQTPAPMPSIKAEPLYVDRPSSSFVKRSAVPSQGRKNDPKQSYALPQISEDHKENEGAKNTQSLTTGRRKSVVSQDLHKDNKRSSCALKPFDLQSKKGKFGDAGRPNKQFYQMIEEFRETLNKVPMSLTDQVEAQRICVCVRKRPLNKQEVIRKEIDVISIPGNGTLLVHEPKTKVDLTKYLENQVFHFDHSFDETTTNELVYRYMAKPLLHTIFEGGMATCFAYGQTGSGKTHTMGGDFAGKNQNSANGIYAFAAQDVFTLLNQRRYSGMDLCPYVTFFEIYNGKVFDLLNKKSKLRVMEDEKQQVQVVGLEEMYVSCVDDVIRMIKIGSACRTSGQTSANANSSRSHAVLQVVLRRRDKLHGKLSLVDLAGNERGTDVSSNHRQTIVETAEINRSLLALKECIRSLGQNSDHIPFRMSKLTQVLRDSFIGENSKTCMIAMVSPGMASCDYTLNTLRYADRVKELNGSSKPSKGERPARQAEYANSSQDDGSSSSSSEEDSIVPSVFDAISKVAELEERVHEELQMASEVLKPMEQVSYDIEAGAPELEDYARKLLDSVLALRAAIDEERMARMSPKPGCHRV